MPLSSSADCTLYIIRTQAYESYIQEYVTMDEQLPEEESLVLNQKSPIFKFWNTTFEMELTLEFVKGIRNGNFMLYAKILIHMSQYMLALNHRNYSRWLPVHNKCMMNLEIQNPRIYYI